MKILLASSLPELGEVERAKELAGTAWELLQENFGSRHELPTLAARQLLAISLVEEDPQGTQHWIEQLRWLAKTPEKDVESVMLGDIRREVLEIIELERL